MAASILCMCEGICDEAFFERLLEKYRLNRSFHILKSEDLKTPGIEPPKRLPTGIDSFETRLGALWTATNFDIADYDLLVLVADNDDDPNENFKIVVKQLRKAEHFAVPVKPRLRTKSIAAGSPDIVVLMLPWDDEEGNLETLLFRAAQDRQPKLARCVDRLVTCAEVSKWAIGDLSKLKARTIFSLKTEKNADKPIHAAFDKASGKGKKGAAAREAKRNPFPLGSARFSRIGAYLRELSDEVRRQRRKSRQLPFKFEGDAPAQ